MFPSSFQFRVHTRLRAGLIAVIAIVVVGLNPAAANAQSNRAPVLLQVENVAVAVDAATTFDVFATDANHDHVTYSFTTLRAPDGSLQPLSALGISIVETVDALARNVGRVSLVTGPSTQRGVWKLSVLAIDAQFAVSDERVVSISVGVANSSPVFISPLDGYDFILVESAPWVLPVTASDPDGDSVTLTTREALPPGATFTQTSGVTPTGTLTWTPGVGSAGEYIVYLDATDSGSPAITATRRITVHVSKPPLSATKVVAVIPNEGPPFGGTMARVYGQGFTDNHTVVVCGNQAFVTFISSTELMFISPSRTFSGNLCNVTVTIPFFAGPEETDTLRGGWLYRPLEAPVVSLPDVNLINRTAVTFAISGRPFSTVRFKISSAGGGEVSEVTDLGPTGDRQLALDLSGLGDGLLTATVNLTDGWGNEAPTTIVNAVKDTVPPALTLPGDISVTVTNNMGEVVNWTAEAFDSRDGSVTSNCSPTSGSLFAMGTTTVTCNATDALGNTSTGSFTVSVIHSWSGMLSPIIDGGTYHFGRVLPLKFRLTGASAGVTDLVAHLTLYKISNGVAGTPIDAEAPGNGDSGNQFRYDASSGAYVFNLSTKNLSEGTWRLAITFDDGSVRTATISLAR